MVRVREFAGVACVAFAAMGIAMALQAAHVDVATLFPQTVESRIAAPAVAAAKPIVLAQASYAIVPASALQPVAPEFPTVTPQDQVEEVALRVRSSVPAHLYPYFDVFLYVSKAASGPWAQHMYVFHKDPSGQLAFEESFPVSTGREMREKYFTTTPTGLFELDPNRFDRRHFSRRWHGAPMPWAMFWNYNLHGHMTGIALHSGIGHVADLGRRASGGCVRMPPEKAEMLFKRFQAEERGTVPVFAYDPLRDTTSVDGVMEADAQGNPILASGYRVLLLVQDYPGGPTYVASLS